MIVQPVPNVAEPVINWNTLNVLEYIQRGEDTGLILFLNETMTTTEDSFLALCIHNSSSNEMYTPGKMYPGSLKLEFKLYDGQIILSNT